MKHIVVCVGDTHCGSTVGLCPPEGLELDDEGLYLPSKPSSGYGITGKKPGQKSNQSKEKIEKQSYI